MRVTEKERARFKQACNRLGLSMSDVLREAIRKTISKSRAAGSYNEGDVIE